MEVIVTPEAKKQYTKLPQTEKKKIIKKLEALETNPLLGKRLAGEFVGLRSIKAWPYRIIYIIKEKQKEIWVVSILHRQKAYK